MDIQTLTENKNEQALIAELLANGQEHLFVNWDEDGINDEAKAAFLKSLTRINGSYPGGLTGYISNARKLLAEAKTGANPFEGFIPHQPDKVDLTKFDAAYDHYEALGKAQFDKTAVVLVAGGLGERLGYGSNPHPGVRSNLILRDSVTFLKTSAYFHTRFDRLVLC